MEMSHQRSISSLTGNPLGAIRTAIAEAINNNFSCLPKEIINKISFEIGYPKYRAHFTTTIALTLAGYLKLDALQIAKAIATSVEKALFDNAASPPITQWQIQAVGKGWLNISLQDEYLANALFDLSHQSTFESTASPQPQKLADTESPELRLQYVYARCCALLRLATSYQDFSKDKICLPQFEDCLQPEISLLLRNLAIADYLGNNDVTGKKLSKNLLRSLTTDFLNFYDHCRIFSVNADIAYRRILVIEVTRKMILRLSDPEIVYAEYL
ncbi:MAG: hypothetical protein DCE90_13915 [Pseudanabaena sp.]|nr:MAG: hypothetical protein DCE90_13915 [Pseudanabaena sp.]